MDLPVRHDGAEVGPVRYQFEYSSGFPSELNVTVSGNFDHLDEVVRNFADFLRACGYVFDRLDVVEATPVIGCWSEPAPPTNLGSLTVNNQICDNGTIKCVVPGEHQVCTDARPLGEFNETRDGL